MDKFACNHEKQLINRQHKKVKMQLIMYIVISAIGKKHADIHSIPIHLDEH